MFIKENFELIISIIGICLIIYILLFKNKKNRHQRNIEKSKNIIELLNKFSFNGQKINYLKKIDPYVFEELLLSSFEKKGYKIKRSKRYSGDGGVDGIIYDNDNNEIYIQAKRYKNYINLQHLKDFENLINSKNVKGYFIHTGKTGSKSKDFINNANLNILSGDKLINLITNKL